jgi:MFS family permease
VPDRFEKSPGFDRRVWLLLLAMLAFRFGQGLYFPFSTIHFHNVVGIPLSLVGVGLGSLAVASVASGLISGPLSDRYGRKPVMLAALAGSSVTFCAFALVEGFTGYLLVSVAAGLAGNSTFDALFGTCFGTAYGVSPIVAGALLEARLLDFIWQIQLAAAGLAAVALVVLRGFRLQASAINPRPGS